LLQAIWAAVSIIDLAHHDYVGFECLRFGPAQRPAITRIIFSAAPIVVLIANEQLKGITDMIKNTRRQYGN